VLSFDLFITAAHTTLSDVRAPNGLTSLLEFCQSEVSRELRCSYNGADIASCIEKLSSYNTDAEAIFAYLLAARFNGALGRHADILLDEIRANDEDLVFEINNQTYRCKASYGSNCVPIRFLYLDGYKDVLSYHKITVPCGQHFGF
jgi:hypothetical protein